MAGLNFDNIMSEDLIDNLFVDETLDETTEETVDTEQPDDDTEENIIDEKIDTTEVDPETLFSDKPESVGGEDESQAEEDTDDSNDDDSSSSPDTNFFSSIANALHEEGIFPDLDDKTRKNIKSPEDFAHAVEAQIQAKFDERQKRIDDALNYNVEPTEIQNLDKTLTYLNGIKEDAITDESDKGLNIRQQLIYQDYLNKGYTDERAKREVKKSVDANTDIEDAKDALQYNKEFYGNYYDGLIQKGKDHDKSLKDLQDKEAKDLRKALLQDKEIFGEIKLDQKTRQKIYDNIAKPAYRDEDTGEYFTPIQKYQMENKAEFMRNVGLVYTLTDGFKNLEGLTKGTVRKQVKKGLKELESTLNNTSRSSDGNLKFSSGVADNPEGFIGKDWALDI